MLLLARSESFDIDGLARESPDMLDMLVLDSFTPDPLRDMRLIGIAPTYLRGAVTLQDTSPPKQQETNFSSHTIFVP